MHFSCTAPCTFTWIPFESFIHSTSTGMHMYLFIEINAIFIIHNINSDISYIVVAHTLFRIKLAIKIELDVVCDPVLM